MTTEPRLIHVSQQTDITTILAEASEAAVLIEKDGRLYRVSPEPEDLSVGYDPTAVRQALQVYADLLTPAEGKQTIAALYDARVQGTRQASRS